MRESGARLARLRSCFPFRLVWNGVLIACLMLSGCSYTETMMNRRASPDDRIQLTRQHGTLFLAKHEIEDYTCARDLLFRCERGGAGKFTCRCALR